MLQLCGEALNKIENVREKKHFHLENEGRGDSSIIYQTVLFILNILLDGRGIK